MQRRFVMCLVALSLTLACAASASAMVRPFQIGFGGGASVPVSDAKDAFKSGFHGKAMVQWKAPVLPFAVRGSFGYERFDLKGLVPGSSGNGRILSGVGDLSYGFPVGPVRPYLIAGVGAYNLNATVNGTSGTSQTKLGIDGGAGVEFHLGGISAFAEARLENIFTDQGLGSTSAFDTRIFPVTFGVFF